MAGATVIGIMLASCESLPVQGVSGGNVDTEPATETEAKISDSFVSAARTSEDAGDYVSAAGYWQNLLDRDPTDLEAAIGLADNLRRLGQYGYAINVLNDALGQHPDDPRLLSLLGRTLVADGNATAALDPLQRSVAIEPGMWETQAALAVAYGMLGELARSNEANMRALAASPDNPKVLNNMGLQAAMQGDLDGAIELLERASRGDEADSKIRLNLALLLAYRGDIEEAEGLVREELSGEEAEQNIAFFRSLAGNDLQNLEELVAQSNLGVEAQPLPPVDEGDTLALNQSTATAQPTEPTTVIVEPVEEVVVPAADIVDVQAAPATETSGSDIGVEAPADETVTMTYDDQPQDLPELDTGRDSDEFVLPPETIVTTSTTEEVVATTPESDEGDAAFALAPEVVQEPAPAAEPEPVEVEAEVVETVDAVEPAETAETIATDDDGDDLSILEMIGSITAPAPGAGSGGEAASDARANARDDDLPTDNAFDFQYFDLSDDSEEPTDN
ncbi:MAG: tetratricopeptide repeat protein [Pseudomonadota bacterium]